MPRPDHPGYRLLLKLYPRSHRQAYGEQMVQTLDDLLAEGADSRHSLAVWTRVLFELPKNLIEEHIDNLKEKNMKKSKPGTKQIIGAVVVTAVIATGVTAAILLTSARPYVPTTLAKVPRANRPPACAQLSDNPKVTMSPSERSSIEMAVVTSITDVPAGTNVDVHIGSLQTNTASGTAVYAGKYGTYNFTATKPADTKNPNWSVTKLEACRR